MPGGVGILVPDPLKDPADFEARIPTEVDVKDKLSHVIQAVARIKEVKIDIAATLETTEYEQVRLPHSPPFTISLCGITSAHVAREMVLSWVRGRCSQPFQCVYSSSLDRAFLVLIGGDVRFSMLNYSARPLLPCCCRS